MLAQMCCLSGGLQLVKLDTSLDQVLLLHATHGVWLLIVERIWSVEASRALLTLIVRYCFCVGLFGCFNLSFGRHLLIFYGYATTGYAACLWFLLLGLG